MKIRGIEIAIGVYGQGQMPTRLGVVPLDIDVPTELTKTDWTPLEVIVTVLTSTVKHSLSLRVTSNEQDMNFRIDHNMIAAAAAELQKRVDAQRVQLCSLPEAFGVPPSVETIEEAGRG